ncbi:unnamed protein product [Plutella xylostella]|uniref:dolichyl-P-Man:Man5GlcNAc2-PP-dolichol alpha-1,3-mannosyltransferase n=1 Tax=Plutella xylostella TaxID=51655 RepID=A0A8S4E1I0_PLUXY|nr:unnamed protein product [Plutella xylostella]
MGGNFVQETLHQVKKMFSWTFLKNLMLNPAQLPFVACLILVAELILNILVVERVPYTEIDWKAYMQECEGFLNGTLDYSKLRGDTGPLVYPAGFVYIYSMLYYITNQGENKQVQPQIDAKNQQVKGKSKLKKSVKINPSQKEEEILSKEQEDFLRSFESSIAKQSGKGVKKSSKAPKPVEVEPSFYSINYDIVSQLFILPMFIVNFIGVVCARSLHYQFYSWYFHSLPYLLWSNNYSTMVRFFILALIEMCWNTYPSTSFTSALLHVCHVAVLFGVYKKISSELRMASKVE